MIPAEWQHLQLQNSRHNCMKKKKHLIVILVLLLKETLELPKSTSLPMVG